MNFKKNNWVSLFSKNLSNHSDENFKLAQFSQIDANRILFDLRETYRGRKTDNGFSLYLPEFFWFKNVLQSKTQGIHKLEHNNRKIEIDKTIPDVLISVTTTNGNYRKMILESSEIEILLNFINNIEDRLKCKAESIGAEINFNEQSFYTMSVN